MIAARSEALALKVCLRLIQDDRVARKLRWRVGFNSDRTLGAFSRYVSTLEMTGTDGATIKTASIPLFQDGCFLHTPESLEAAVLVAVTETAMAVQEPIKLTPVPRRRASDLMSA